MLSRVGRVVLAVAATLVISVASAAADPDRALSIEDVLRLHGAGVSESVIASEIAVTNTVFELSVEEILRLKEAGLSEELLQFMVETGLPPADYADEEIADPDATGEDPYEAAKDEGESYARIWVNEIEEEPATVFVSLDYSYPTWWYDFYWYDYWYYDCSYLPYRYNYSWSFGVYYPGWYSYRYCYLPSYYGYWHRSWYRWGYHWNDYAHCYDPYWGYTASPVYRHHERSNVKYKTGSSGGKLLYADAGLKIPDARRLVKGSAEMRTRLDGKRRLVAEKTDIRDLRGNDGRRPVRGGDVAVADTRLVKPDGLDRPVRPVRRPVVSDRVKESRRPIRQPAVDSRPVRTPDRGDVRDSRPTRPVRPTVRKPSDSVRDDRPTRPDPTPDRRVEARPDPTPTKPQVEKPSKPKPKPKPQVETPRRQVKPTPAPTPPARQVKPAPQRSAPPAKSSPPQSRGGGKSRGGARSRR